jgi:hypothetical protein
VPDVIRGKGHVSNRTTGSAFTPRVDVWARFATVEAVSGHRAVSVEGRGGPRVSA